MPKLSKRVKANQALIPAEALEPADDAVIAGEFSTGLTGWMAAELESESPASLTFRVPAGFLSAGRVFVRAVVTLR